MTDSSQNSTCYLAALRLLTGRDYTCLSLQRKLLQRKFSAVEITTTVNRLTSEGYLQDRRYAERFVLAARESGCFVGYRLQQELRRRGVPPELIGELTQESPECGEQLERAQDMVARRYRGFDPKMADDRDRRRIAGFLQRRGYGGEVIRRLLYSGSLSTEEEKKESSGEKKPW